MTAPRIKTRSIAIVLATTAILTTLGASTATARSPVGVGRAVAVGAAVGAGAQGDRATTVCARLAQRKTRRSPGRARASAVTAKRTRRAKVALVRRCKKRLRHADQSSVAPAPTVPAIGPLTVGTDGGYDGWHGEELEMRTALGASVTRHEWDPSEPVDAQEDLVIEAASEVHTRIHALLGGNDLGDPAHYSEWVVAFIRRYGVGGSFWSEHPELDAGRYAITTFELGNEPYFGTMSATEYAETVRPTLEAVHQLGLPAKLILPSYIYGTDTHWIDTLYQKIPKLNSLFYAFADHPYWYGHAPSQGGDGNSPFERLATLRRRMNEHGAGAKPIFITEYGESTADCGEECVSESVQATHIQEMIEAVATHAEWGVELLCLYQLHDWATESGSREEQFGLLREDGTPKPAYAIARSAMQRYHG